MNENINYNKNENVDQSKAENVNYNKNKDISCNKNYIALKHFYYKIFHYIIKE